MLKTINYKIVSEEESVAKYIPVYFQDRNEVVPIWLRPKAMDFNTNLLKEGVKMIPHIILKISDLGKIRFDCSSLELIGELEIHAARVVFDCHDECYRERCWKVPWCNYLKCKWCEAIYCSRRKCFENEAKWNLSFIHPRKVKMFLSILWTKRAEGCPPPPPHLLPQDWEAVGKQNLTQKWAIIQASKKHDKFHRYSL